MKNYSREQMIQVGFKLLHAHYAVCMINKIRSETGGKTAQQLTLEHDHWFTERITFYQDDFLLRFADALSFFYLQNDQEVLEKVRLTAQERKEFYELRSVITHIDEWEKMIGAWKRTHENPAYKGLVEDFINVRDYFFKTFYKRDREGATYFEDKFKAIDSHFNKDGQNADGTGEKEQP